MARRRKLLILIAGIAAFSIGFLTTLKSAPAQERFDMKVRDDFFAGFGGDREALDRAMKACEDSLAANSNNAEAMVWYGAGLYYLGGNAFQTGDSQKGRELVQKGLGEMSRAVELEPSNVIVRIPRGAVLLQSTLLMPDEEFARALVKLGLDDYLRTLEVQSDYLGELGTHPRGELLFGIASAQHRLGNVAEADKMFRRIATGLNGSRYAKRAEKWLRAKTLTPQEQQCTGCHVP